MIPVRFLQEYKNYMIGDVAYISDEKAVRLFENGVVEELEADDEELAFLEEENGYIDEDEEYYG